MTLSVENIKNGMESMIFNLGQGELKTLSFTFSTQLRFGVHFLQRIKTSLGYGTVIGELIDNDFEPQLYVWLDQCANPSPLPLNQNFSKDINPLYRLYPERVVTDMARRFKNCPIKSLIAVGNNPLTQRDSKNIFKGNTLHFINQAEKNWSEWLVMARYHFKDIGKSIESYLDERHDQLPLQGMQAVGDNSVENVNWSDFPFPNESCYIKNAIEGVQTQLDYLQSRLALTPTLPSQRESLEKLVALLSVPLQKRRQLLEEYQQAPLSEALGLQKKQLQMKQEFEWLFSNIHHQHFDTHSRMMQFIFNTWIEIQGQLEPHQQEQNQAILLKLAEHAYHEALNEKATPAGSEIASTPDETPPPYYVWAFVFAMSQNNAFINRACTHLFIKTLCPQYVQSFDLPEFEQWCQKNPQGVRELHEQLLKNTHFNRLKNHFFTHGQRTFQLEMVKFQFYYVNALVAQQHSREACCTVFINDGLPALSELILQGYRPAIRFVTNHLNEAGQGGSFFGTDYNLAITLIRSYERREKFTEAWFFFKRLETLPCASVVKRDTLPTETVALLQILFNETARDAALELLLNQAKSGASLTLQQRALDALQQAGRFVPVAALACVKYFIEKEPRSRCLLSFMPLAREADPAEAAYLNYLFMQHGKKLAPVSLIKAASRGHPLACSALESCMDRFVGQKNTQLVNDFFIPAILEGKLQKYLSPEIVVRTLMLMIDAREEWEKPAYTIEIMSRFITTLVKENPPSRNTLIAMLLAQAQGRFSEDVCEKLSKARDFSHSPKNGEGGQNEQAPPCTNSLVMAMPSFATQEGLFAKAMPPADKRAENTPPSSPGANPL